MLHGRAAELAAIDRLLAGAREGRGGGLVLRGEPGIGKSALLGEAAARAARDMRVLHAVGVEGEASLAYAALHQLLLPVLDRLDALPAPQAHALRIAFGLAGAGGEQEDVSPFLVAVAALTLLSELADRQPLLCVVDDVQWADAPSRDALAFAGRRLGEEPVGLLMAIRADDGEGAPVDTRGIEELRVAGLAAADATRLLDERWGDRVAPTARAALMRVAAGNPLALIELPGALTGWQLTGADPVREPLPLTGELERAFLERARSRGPAVGRLLLLAAADDSGRLATVRRAAAVLALDASPLEGAGLADLVDAEGAEIAFRHPLVRSAVYHGAAPAERRAAHAALAQATDGEDPERAAWHRAAAAVEPDEAIARELEDTAARTLRRAGHGAAAAALVRAAELTPQPGERARRLVAAARAAWEGGDAAGTRALLDDVAQSEPPLDPGVRLDARELRGLIELHAGIPAEGIALLLPAAEEAVERGDAPRAARLLGVLADGAYQVSDMAAMERVGELAPRVETSADDPADDALLLRLLVAARQARTTDGGESALGPAERAALERIEDPAALVRAGGLVWGHGDFDLGRRLHTRAAELARARGAAGTLTWALQAAVTDDTIAGRLAAGEAQAHEALALALETGQVNGACVHRAILGSIVGARGREAEARALLDAALAEATLRRLPRARTIAQVALGGMALAAGRSGEALEQLEAIWRPGPVPPHLGVATYAVPDLVEAAVRAGAPERCAEPLAHFEQWTTLRGDIALRPLLLRCRALLAPDAEEAEALFRAALAGHAGSDHLIAHARTELLLGEHLRRERRRVDARVHLRAALEAFERMGVPVMAERARAELRASGETARRRDDLAALDALTPQELQIARAVAEGATNREVAARLFISPRTVDYHLRKVFRKLEISSRAELIRLGADELVA
ncbi:MAG TPA: AAA family ATPase [Conexibacter sp.]|jgi:DNA-binding CsgD family transcriptional regulator|nr:AAA family ATPase [Conexibacter sp.]